MRFCSSSEGSGIFAFDKPIAFIADTLLDVILRFICDLKKSVRMKYEYTSDFLYVKKQNKHHEKHIFFA
jgi:hypothetical protein